MLSFVLQGAGNLQTTFPRLSCWPLLGFYQWEMLEEERSHVFLPLKPQPQGQLQTPEVMAITVNSSRVSGGFTSLTGVQTREENENQKMHVIESKGEKNFKRGAIIKEDNMM